MLKTVNDGKNRNLCKRKFCLECSPFGNHNTKKLVLNAPTFKDIPIGSVFQAECKKHGDTRFVLRHSGKRQCLACGSEAVILTRRNKKKKLVEMFGGCCVKCGYKKCQQALQFHHLDPSTKKFNIAQKGHCRKWDEVIEEAKKCILVCGNCHTEIENGIE